jgi:hypothetical protein
MVLVPSTALLLKPWARRLHSLHRLSVHFGPFLPSERVCPWFLFALVIADMIDMMLEEFGSFEMLKRSCGAVASVKLGAACAPSELVACAQKAKWSKSARQAVELLSLALMEGGRAAAPSEDV